MTDKAEPETVTMSQKRFRKLLTCEKELRALKAFGVDNWEGYSEAMRAVYGDEEETE
jgi:hypothetical protein